MTDHKETDLKKGLDKDDIALWQEMTSDVERLEGREYVEPTEPKKRKTETREVPSKPAPPVKAQRPVSAPQSRNIDRNTEKRLKRGELPIEGKLDLHGMNQGQARDALIHFIRSAEAAGKRCVLVVTGKGGDKRNTGRSSADWMDRELGVLKKNVPHWLYEAELGSLVLQAVPARPRHGGDGALYVYLRRRRD